MINLNKDFEKQNEENLEQRIEVSNYEKDYSEKGLFAKIVDNVKAVGLTLIYKALQLFYVAQSPNCPTTIKAGIFAALGYFISPLDMIPDFIPIGGYSDDALAIAAAIAMAQIYITPEIKKQAKDKIATIFGNNAVAELD